ncbi:unnamed protein product, partial [Rotaria sp. Silwood2]
VQSGKELLTFLFNDCLLV